MFNLKAAKEGCIISVAFDTGRVLGHHVGHELVSLIKDVIGIDQDVADVIVEIVANGSDDQTGLLINQESPFATLGGAINGRP